MSDSERPELQTFRELEALVHHLVEELATFRRRALRAESRVKELEQTLGGEAVQVVPSERLADLERENAALQELVETARTRAHGILDRVHFLRQQAQGGEA